MGTALNRMDLREGFVLWRGLGVNYEFGVLDHEARTAVHMVRRAGALAVFLYVGQLSWVLVARAADPLLRRLGWTIGILLVAQICLGIGNVVMTLPLAVAVAHNGVAALLISSLLTLNLTVWHGRTTTTAGKLHESTNGASQLQR